MSSGNSFEVAFSHDVEAFAIRLHQPVFDAVVHHLHEVPGAIGPAVQIAEVGGAAFSRAALRWARHRPVPGARVLKIGSRCLKIVRLGADHQTVAALDAPDAAAGAGIHVMNAFVFEQRPRAARRLCNTNCRRR